MMPRMICNNRSAIVASSGSSFEIIVHLIDDPTAPPPLDFAPAPGLHCRPVQRTRSERRRYGRIKLDDPLRARFGDVEVRVIELSVSGFLVAHEGRFAASEPRQFVIDWEGTPIALECTVARSTLYRLGKNLGEKSVYHTGLHIVRIASDGFEVLRKLIG